MARASYSATPLLRSLVHRPQGVILVLLISGIIQTEAERRRREAGVKQSMEIRLKSCGWVGGGYLELSREPRHVAQQTRNQNVGLKISFAILAFTGAEIRDTKGPNRPPPDEFCVKIHRRGIELNRRVFIFYIS